MTATPPSPLLEESRRAITLALGFELDAARDDDVERLLTERCGRDGRRRAAYVEALLRDGPRSPEVAHLAARLTVGETYFFRNAQHMRALEADVLPPLVAKAERGEPVAIASLGAATGEELYSVAILLHRACPALLHRFELVGIDVDPAKIALARLGAYSMWSLRATSDDDRAHYFDKTAGGVVLHAAIRAMARFEVGNLLDDQAWFYSAPRFDLVLCRNVLMYFGTERMQERARRVASTVVEGGYLFLGPAESVSTLGQGWRSVHAHETFFGHRTSGAEERRSGRGAAPAAVHDAVAAASAAAEPVASASLAASESTWRPTPDAVAPPAAVAPRPPPASARRPPRAAAPADGDGDDATLAAAIEAALRAERFVDVVARLDAVGAARRAAFAVDHAVALGHLGRVADARAVLEAHLARQALDADAWLQLAVCHECAGELGDARAAADKAIYLDPTFALAHLVLARVQTLVGQPSRAHVAWRCAAVLLEFERDERLRRFAGGFGRRALADLCARSAAALVVRP